MSVAVWGFLGVVLGGALTGAVSLWQAQLVTRREREAREALREQERKDRRDQFQRETILALQEVVTNLHRAANAEQIRMRAEYQASGIWPTKKGGEPLPDYQEANWSLGRLRARVFDEELRTLTREVRDAVFNSLFAPDRDTMGQRTAKANELYGSFNERVTVLLADLF